MFGHRKTDDTIPMDNVHYETRTGVKIGVITTNVFQLKVKWDSHKNSYISLKDIKETNPMDIEEYAKENNINKT